MAVLGRFRQNLPRSLFLVGKAVFLMAMQSASAPAAAQAMVAGDSQTTAPNPELFGVEIGTEAKWAARTLRRRGFVLRATETGPSWHWQFGARMGHIAPRKHRHSTIKAVMAGPSGEQLELVFMQTQNGAAVSRMSARWPDSIAPEILSDAFERRYGVSKGTFNTAAIRVDGELGRLVQPYVQLDAGARTLVIDAEAELRVLEQESIERAVRDAKRAEIMGW